MRRAISAHWNTKVRQQHGLNIFWQPECTGQWDIPQLQPTSYIPNFLWAYNERSKLKKITSWKDSAIHFFLDDYWFNVVWFYAKVSAPQLIKFPALLTPDFSLYRNWAHPLQVYNVYRTRWLGAYWQHLGGTVIPTANWSTPELHELCFSGLPVGGTFTISTMETSRDALGEQLFFNGLDFLLQNHKPDCLLVYGKGFKGTLEAYVQKRSSTPCSIVRYAYQRDLIKAMQTGVQPQSLSVTIQPIYTPRTTFSEAA